VTALGATYGPESHGVELRECAGSGKKLDESAFVDWYVRMIFATDEDEDDDADAEGGVGSAPAAGSWAGMKWAVAPTGACSVSGKM
jgi:hypothetical protein